MIDAVLFDLDETLLDRSTSLKAFLADQYERHSFRLGNASLASWCDRFLALDQRGHVHKSLVYPDILAEFGGQVEDAGVLLADYQSQFSAFVIPFEGMKPALGEIRSRNLRIGIVTNGETEFQTRNIEALGLDCLVDKIFISQQEGLRKPDAALFRRVAEVFGTAPENCLFVGDNPVADILGAAATGMKTAWFRGEIDWPPDAAQNPGHTIRTLAAIADLLNSA